MKNSLQVNQCVALLSAISARGTKHARILDQALVVSLILSGGRARLWTWGDLETNLRDLPYAVFDAIRAFALSRRILIAPFNYTGFRQRHWESHVTGHPIFSVSTTPLTTQEISRRIRRYGRIAGIPSDYLNLRTLSNTHQALMRSFGDGESIAHALGLPTVWDRSYGDQIQLTSATRDPRLHGIGRRKSIFLSSGR